MLAQTNFISKQVNAGKSGALSFYPVVLVEARSVFYLVVVYRLFWMLIQIVCV